MYLPGLGNKAFLWFGELVGVDHLRVSPQRIVDVGPYASTAKIINEAVVSDGIGDFQ